MTWAWRWTSSLNSCENVLCLKRCESKLRRRAARRWLFRAGSSDESAPAVADKTCEEDKKLGISLTESRKKIFTSFWRLRRMATADWRPAVSCPSRWCSSTPPRTVSRSPTPGKGRCPRRSRWRRRRSSQPCCSRWLECQRPPSTIGCSSLCWWFLIVQGRKNEKKTNRWSEMMSSRLRSDKRKQTHEVWLSSTCQRCGTRFDCLFSKF